MKRQPTPLEVCERLEEWTAESETLDGYDDAQAICAAAYRWCHIARNPSCLHVHQDWIDKFWGNAEPSEEDE